MVFKEADARDARGRTYKIWEIRILMVLLVLSRGIVFYSDSGKKAGYASTAVCCSVEIRTTIGQTGVLWKRWGGLCCPALSAEKTGYT